MFALARLTGLAGLVVLVSCSSTPKPAPTPGPDEPNIAPADAGPKKLPLSGTYLREHTVPVVCDKPDWCDQPVIDVLRISEGARGALDVRIELVQTNAHTCTFEGRLTETGPAQWEYAKDGEYPCKVTFTVKANQLSFESEGCREYCGARAHLMGSFEHPPADSDPTAFDCDARCDQVAACHRGPAEIKTARDDCQSACYQAETIMQRAFDDCVRDRAGDCEAIARCSAK